MTITEVEAILAKHKKEEEKIEKLLHEKISTCNSQNDTREDKLNPKTVLPSLAQAKERNQTLIKELEIVKGNLRSKAIFSPSEFQWEKICKQYRMEPSLPVTTWRCHLPVFV